MGGPIAVHGWLAAAGAVVVVGLAAALRLPGLDARGMFDADQGRHMLVLRAFVFDGVVPLLGPSTSIGNAHHGALYYLLLAPAAALSGASPVAVTLEIALAGVVAVGAVAWLARSIGGTAAGFIAGILYAVSASAVAQSVFIWNPNLIGAASAIALAAAWQAWSTRNAGWWLVAGAAAVATAQFHVLGAILTPILVTLLVADSRRRMRDIGDTGVIRRVAAGWVVIGLILYLPLIVHELTTGGAEVRALMAFMTGGGEAPSVGLPIRIVVIGLRVLCWPLTGLLTDAPAVSIVTAVSVLTLSVWLARRRRGAPVEAPAMAARWLGVGLLWTVIALSVGSPNLATVVPGLPNDDYHAFADPMVVVLVGVGLASVLRRAPGSRAAGVGRFAAVAAVVALLGWNLTHQPPPIAPDGGWLAARDAAARVTASAGSAPLLLPSLPIFKGDDALRMPLEAAGANVVPAASPSTGAGSVAPPVSTAAWVVLCDDRFRESIGLSCGGAAEDAWLRDPRSGFGGSGGTPRSATLRFEAAPGRWISVYDPPAR